ncbi:MAG: cobalamin-dependent protein, partial [Desulfovibrio sp.]
MQKVVFVNLYETCYLGTRCLASYLRAKGHETHNILFEEYRHEVTEEPRETEIIGYHMYINGQVYEQPTIQGALPARSAASLSEAIRLEKPDIIGFSARSTHNYLAPELAHLFKEAAPNALLVAGGYGPTLTPEIYLDAGFDVVVRGDGEEAMLELVNAWEKRDRATLLAVPGTTWAASWGGGGNPLRDQKKDLSCYPAPLSGNDFFSYIENGELRRHLDPVLSGRTYFTFFGRGCIGTCSYCSGGNWSKMYRAEGKKAYKRRNRAIDDVIHELAALPANIDTIIFADEYWGNSRDRTKEFFGKYRDQVRRNFFAYLDYEQMMTDGALFNLVLDAGLMATGIGFQTGSKEFALKYYHRRQNFPLLVDYCHKLFENKIHVNP